MSLFLSHGAPTLLLHATPAHRFLLDLGERLPRPGAIVVISAHWQTRGIAVTGASHPGFIYDFYGFPDPLYDVAWPVSGAPALADAIAKSLGKSGFAARVDNERGLDHGVWVPLSLMYPAAEVPIVQVSLPLAESPSAYRRLGEALAPLENDGVLIVGSGGLTHNLRAVSAAYDAPEDPRVGHFRDAVDEQLLKPDGPGLLHWETLPFARFHHPTPEHILPLLVVARGQAERLHASTEHSVLAMDAWSFE